MVTTFVIIYYMWYSFMYIIERCGSVYKGLTYYQQ